MLKLSGGGGGGGRALVGGTGEYHLCCIVEGEDIKSESNII